MLGTLCGHLYMCSIRVCLIKLVGNSDKGEIPFCIGTSGIFRGKDIWIVLERLLVILYVKILMREGMPGGKQAWISCVLGMTNTPIFSWSWLI